jgi:hypothetical protein
MKIPNHSIALILTFSILLFSCVKENPPINQREIWDFHHKMTWDTLSTKKTLIGEWEWEYIGCFWNPDCANYNDFKGMTIEFKSDNTLHVRENGRITQTMNWKVVKGDADLFRLDADPGVFQLNGRILFCDERVEFNHSYIDGCDNYFKRKK